ncbi:MAG TPA: DUF4142 domain-containing protein [Candidatus Acidoferrales bacterium]|nr:DUF4142 domain-containing protein [Candidatus Acidoferrales bacterium]
MKHYLAFAAIFAFVLIGCTAWGQEANRLVSADSTFVRKAAQGGLAEVELGTLATQRASNEMVKRFGQRMVDDHTKANDDLKAIASRKGVMVPATIDAESRVAKTHLSNLHGAEFDRAYMKDMVSDHEKDIAEFQREADHGADSDVKAFAARTLPTLHEHLKMAQEALSDVERSAPRQ